MKPGSEEAFSFTPAMNVLDASLKAGGMNLLHAASLVVPDGSLCGIPIGALPDPEDTNRYLLERVTIGYLTSTYELSDASRTTSQVDDIKRSLLIGAPDFGRS